MMLTVATRAHFDAAHHIPNYPGKCAALHGHRWEVDVEYKTIAPIVLDDSSMLVDFIAVRAVIKELDHRYLNDVDGLECPSAEIIAGWLFDNMPKPPCHCIVTVTVWESPESCATWSGMIAPDEEDENE